ncbi:MAG: carboxyl transferase domain-containing protein [Eubacteriales bacterium]|nr:carboxyl transferase domain-containing protein [Eubacteriales bacterium]
MSNTTQVSARTRIESILDDSSFVEIGAGITARATDFNIQEKKALTDGVITGYGVINGNLVYVYSQDASVMNGSIGEMHAKKIEGLYDMAMKMGAPVIGLIDCAGIRLQEATDALNGFGAIYNKMSMASGVIPQITAVYGKCGGGLAVLAGLSDFTFIEEKNGKLFVNSPNALEGNYDSKLDTASAKFQAEAGVVDFVGDEETIANGVRTLVSILPANNEVGADLTESNDDLNRVCSSMSLEIEDAAAALTDIADDNMFVEVKPDFAKEMVTGFIQIDGTTIGAVANRTAVFDDNGEKSEKFAARLTVDGAYKAADFVNFCNAFDIPVLTLTNVTGFEATVRSEKAIAKAIAKLTYAFANADVPKVNVITGEAYGSAYIAMNSKSIGADMTYAWKNASIGMMDANLAAKIMYNDEIASSEEVNDTIAKKAAEYAELQSSVESAAARGYVDTVINPEDTRKYVAAAFEMLFTKREDRPVKKHGTV